MRERTQHSLLVEIMMALLFFALAAAVLLQMYATAYHQSDEAALLSDVLLHAQNLADECYLAETVQDACIEADGYTLYVTVTQEQTAYGALRKAIVTARTADGDTLVTLPCTRYLSAGEVEP